MTRRPIAAVLAVLLLTACDGSADDGDREPGGSAAPESGSAGTSATTLAETGPIVTCPRFTQEIDPSLPDEVPEGATSVRLCDGRAEKVAPPVDALTTDVAWVVTAVNDQPLARKGCVDLRIPEYQLAFGYSDGSRFVVAGRFTACAELLVGSARRKKAGPPLRTFVESLRAQRSTATPPGPTVTSADLDCGRPPSHLPSQVALPTDLAVAVLCFGRPERPDGAARIEIPAADLTTLVESMQKDWSSSEGYLGCGAVARDEYWIVGESGWGDPIVMTRGCFALTIEGDREWTPRGQARGITRRLVAEVR